MSLTEMACSYFMVRIRSKLQFIHSLLLIYFPEVFFIIPSESFACSSFPTTGTNGMPTYTGFYCCISDKVKISGNCTVWIYRNYRVIASYFILTVRWHIFIELNIIRIMSKLYHPVLSDKISVNMYPFHRFFYGRKTFNDIFHILHQGSNRFHTFCILFCISSLVAVKLVPVL